MKCLILLLTLLTAAPAFAQEKPWRLTTTDFQTRDVAVERFTTAGLQIDGTVVPLARLLRLERINAPAIPTPDPRQFVLHLLNGDRYLGTPEAMEGETLRWKTTRLGVVTVNLADIAGLSRDLAAPGRGLEDVVQLANGDRASGIINGMTAEQITLATANGDVAVPLETVRYIATAELGAPQPAAAPALRIEMRDGTILSSPPLPSEVNQLRIEAAGGRAATTALADVVSIEQAGGSVTWLSQLTPTGATLEPYLDNAQPLLTEARSGVDAPRVLGQTPRRWLSVGSKAELTYDLARGYRTLRLGYALADNLPLGDVKLTILLDGVAALEAQHVRSGSLQTAQLDVTAVKTLQIVVDYGQGLDVQDRLVLVDPAMIRAE